MANLEELFAQLRDPGEAGLPDTIYDDLEFARADMIAAHAQEMDGASSKIQSLESELSRLKTHNYDLLMSTGGKSEEEPGEGEGEGEGEGDENENITIDDLFGD